MPADQSQRHARAMRAPLRAIVGHVLTDTYPDGRPIYHEQLICGHAGDATSPAQAITFAQWGIRRRCRRCLEDPDHA